MVFWKSVTVVSEAVPEKIWAVYRALAWQDWDQDIASMTSEDHLRDGGVVRITMKDGKQHTATLQDVIKNQTFTYTAPLPGAILIAKHELAPAEGGGTTITHSFDFHGVMGGLFRWMTADYVQRGLDTNTQMLKEVAESRE